MTVKQTKFENMKSQARIHCQHSSMGRTETQDGLCAERSRGPRCKITCQSPRSARTDARAPLFNPQPCCLFPLINSPSFRSLNRAGLSSQADNDLCPWESPGKTANHQVKGRGYIWKLPFEETLSAVLSLNALQSVSNLPEHGKLSIREAPLSCAVCAYYTALPSHFP